MRTKELEYISLASLASALGCSSTRLRNTIRKQKSYASNKYLDHEGQVWVSFAAGKSALASIVHRLAITRPYLPNARACYGALCDSLLQGNYAEARAWGISYAEATKYNRRPPIAAPLAECN